MRSPRTLIDAWHAFEASFNVPPRPVDSIQILVAASPVIRGVGYDTYKRAEACSFRVDQEVPWHCKSKLKNPGGALNNGEQMTELVRMNIAVGFLVFSHELFFSQSVYV